MPKLVSSTMNVRSMHRLQAEISVSKLSIHKSGQQCPIQRLYSKIKVDRKKPVIRVHKLGCYNTISQKKEAL